MYKEQGRWEPLLFFTFIISKCQGICLDYTSKNLSSLLRERKREKGRRRKRRRRNRKEKKEKKNEGRKEGREGGKEKEKGVLLHS